MVFFNYSTMQMAAKVVYYGPGLCGKTTNLHYIYQHTTQESRGEMVSLETETDRTLFFDLLPIDVGSIAGFNTRIQLYTVPGQVFYNTTRKLVLKGVDGVVFVADSQRAMLQANADSFRNLEENLAEMGLSVDTLPLVIQFNKRDLADICTPDEMNAALNRHNWPWFEASAVTGMGVFETLKGISKQTLLSLKKRLGRSEPSAPSRPAAPVARPVPPPAAAAPQAPARPPLPPAAQSGSYPQAAQPAPQAAAPAPAPRPVMPPPAPPLPPAAARPPAPAGASGASQGAPRGHRQGTHHGRALRIGEAAQGGHASAGGSAAGGASSSRRYQRPRRAVADDRAHPEALRLPACPPLPRQLPGGGRREPGHGRRARPPGGHQGRRGPRRSSSCA